MKKWKSLVGRIETVSDIVGRISSFLLIPLMFISSTEVILRYVFNSPTLWAWDTDIQLFSVLILAGGAYAYRYNMHVRVDVFVMHFSGRVRAVLDLITSALFFFSFIVLLIVSAQEALNSFQLREQQSAFWPAPIYPLKMLIPVAVFLFLLQGVAHVIRNLLVIIHPEEAK